jgi:hypothetical protein
MHRLHESLPSGLTRGTIWSAACWRRRTGRSCVFRPSPRRTRAGRSTAELGQSSFTRRRGEALHPERQPLATLERIRRVPGFIPGIGEYNFTGQYQQAPSPQGGGMVKAAWFPTYGANERPEKVDRVVQSWDTAKAKWTTHRAPRGA